MQTLVQATVLQENIRIAFEQIWMHKMRSLLTALGVIIGILAVTLMGTAIRGINTGFSKSLEMLGTDILYVQKWPWRDVGDDWALYRNRPNIRLDYASRLNELIAANPHSTLRIAVPGIGATRTVNFNDLSANGVRHFGTSADFALMSTAEIIYGRFFTHQEELSGRNVIIIGADIANALFPEQNEAALGQIVSISGRRFEVIGILAAQGDFLGMQSFDNQCIMPLMSLRKFYRGSWSVEIRVQTNPGIPMEVAQDELTGFMRRIRGLLPEEPADFEINQSEIIEQRIGPIKAGITLAGFFITGLALFVGAIGIMNITFVSVKERTREIGTRRALGARRSSILQQFLFEAVSVCLIGGILGVSLAFGSQFALQHWFPDFPFEFSPDLVLLALTLSVMTGIVSGIAPAWQAARLDPATALRHE